MDESVNIEDMVLNANFDSEKQLNTYYQEENSELLALMDFQTTTIQEEQGNLVIEDTIVHTETRIGDSSEVAQSQQDKHKDGDDDAAPNEPPSNEDAEKDDREHIASEAAVFQPTTMDHNESELVESYSSITAASFEHDLLLEMNPTSKDDAVVENAKETNSATDLTTEEVAPENVQESEPQEDMINGQESAEDLNGTESSPLHESPIKLNSQITNETNYISNESYTIVESQRGEKNKETMIANREGDCNIESSASPAPSKSPKRTRKASGSKKQIEPKNLPPNKDDKKARANTRSTKQTVVSASSFIDNLRTAGSKDSASLRSNSNEDDFAELELINSSVPYTPQNNESLRGRFATVIVTEHIVRRTEMRFYDMVNQRSEIVSRSRVSTNTSEELNNRNTEELVEGENRDSVSETPDDDSMKEVKQAASAKKVAKPHLSTKKPKASPGKRGRPLGKVQTSATPKTKKQVADKETDADMAPVSENENAADFGIILNNALETVARQRETDLDTNNNDIGVAIVCGVSESPIRLNAEHIIMDDLNVESEVVICNTEETIGGMLKINNNEALLRKFNIQPCSVILQKMKDSAKVTKKAKKGKRRSSNIENVQINRPRTNINFHQRLDNDDTVIQQSDSLNSTQTSIPKEPLIFLKDDYVFAKQPSQNGFYPAVVVEHVAEQTYSVRFLSSNGCKVFEKDVSDLISLKDLSKDNVMQYLNDRNDLITVKFCKCIHRSVYVAKPDGLTIKANFNNLLIPLEFENFDVFETSSSEFSMRVRKRTPNKRKYDVYEASTPSKRGRRSKCFLSSLTQ